MDNLIKKVIRCPQCDNLAIKSGNALTTESAIACPYCGYSKVITLKGEEEFKGYGALTFNGMTTQFREPITYNQEKEILKSIEGNANASFFKWSDEYGITVLKGELPAELTPEEELMYQEMIDKQTYYSSFEGSYPSINSSECIPFSEFPSGIKLE